MGLLVKKGPTLHKVSIFGNTDPLVLYEKAKAKATVVASIEGLILQSSSGS